MSVLDIPDLEAAYLLNETSGTTAVDSSGNGNGGDYDRDASNTHFSVSGLGTIRDAQLFNATSDRVTTPATVSFGASFTVAGWFRVDGFSAEGAGFSTCFFGGDLGVYRPLMIDTNQNTLGLAAGGFTNGTNAARSVNPGSALDGEWHHLATVWEFTGGTAGVARFYVDGLLVDTASLTTINPASFVLWLGDGNSSGQELNGAAASCYLFSRALASYEIAQLYAEGPLSQLDVARVGHFKLEEASGLVCRNQVRTTILDEDFSTPGTPGTYGDVPAGDWLEYSLSIDAGDSVGTTMSGGTITFTATNNTDTTLNLGIRQTGVLVSGRVYVLHIRYRVLERTNNGALQIYKGGSFDIIDNTEGDGSWITKDLKFTADGTQVILCIAVPGVGSTVTAEIDSAILTEENAGTPSEDMSGLTAPGVSGRGVLMDGTQHILAPYATGFGSYPFSMGCAFRHDGTAAERTIMAICDADAGSVFWRAKLRSSHELGVNRRNGATEYLSNISGAINTDWHTVLAVFPDATSGIVYLDGVEVYNQTGLDSVAAASAAVDMLIGDFRTTDSVQQMIGNLDDASFWTRALSAAEAAEWHQFTIFPLAARHSAEPLALETSLSL